MLEQILVLFWFDDLENQFIGCALSTADKQVASLIKIHLAGKMPLMKIMFNFRNKDDKDRLVMPIPLDRDQIYHAFLY